MVKTTMATIETGARQNETADRHTKCVCVCAKHERATKRARASTSLRAPSYRFNSLLNKIIKSNGFFSSFLRFDAQKKIGQSAHHCTYSGSIQSRTIDKLSYK